MRRADEQPTPPRLATWLLGHIIPADIRYAALGDFDEIFADITATRGLAAARIWYWGQLGKSFPSFLLDSIRWAIIMLKNYLLIALRNLRRHKGYALINVFGLAVSLACCVLIGLYVHDELSFDQYHEQADRMYRLNFTIDDTNTLKKLAMVSPMVGPELKATYPEVVDAVRFLTASSLVQRQDDPLIQYQENNVLYSDPSVFDIFSFPWRGGDPQTALIAPQSVVLTEDTAQRYFGPVDPIGQVLLFDGEAYTVTGLLGILPANSHFTFDMLVSMSTIEPDNPGFFTNFWALSSHSYVLLSDRAAATTLTEKLPEYVSPRVGEVPDGVSYTLSVEPLSDLYLHSSHRSSLGTTGDLTSLYIFSGIALFILLIACINFVNLTTARSTDRAKEVGVRKVIGAQRRQVATQFLGETMLLAALSALLALFVARLALPAFNAFAGKSLSLEVIIQPMVLFVILATVALVGIIAGGYPAFVLSGHQPIATLRGVFRTSRQGQRLRMGLVVFQFSLSIALMVSTGIVFSQLDFMRDTNLGFEKEHMLIVDFHREAGVQQQVEAVKRALLAHPDVVGVSASGDIPGTGNLHEGAAIEVGADDWQGEAWRYVSADFDFIDTYGIEMVAGRSFSRDFLTDSTQAMIINEAMVAHLGFADNQEALGKQFEQGRHQGVIIGVTKDFHLKSLQQTVEPVYLLIAPERYRYLSLRLASENMTRTMEEVEQLWLRLAPQRSFEYVFLDEQFERQYRADVQFGQVVALFSVLAILVACLGLFGLASLTIQQRTKEIGMRKVLGASVSGIVLLLTKDIARLVLIAFVLAAPLVYFALDYWLSTYPYRIAIGPGHFLGAGLVALVIALATVSFHAIRAASSNPVDTLRYE